MSGLRFRANKAHRPEDEDGDPLALLDKNEDLPLDSADQERIIAELRSRAKQGAALYRSACLALAGLCILLYLLPLPSYLVGTHANQGHLTLFHGPGGGRSSLPGYLLFGTTQVGLLGMMAWELAHLLPLPRLRPTGATYGTAPEAVVQLLSRARGEVGLPPRAQYAIALALPALAPPLLSLLLGNVPGALWWALGAAVLGLAAWSETSIASEERELGRLARMRYTYTTL